MMGFGIDANIKNNSSSEVINIEESKSFDTDFINAILNDIDDESLINSIGDADDLDLRFNSNRTIWVYANVADGNTILDNKELLKNTTLYESPHTALAQMRKSQNQGQVIIRCELNTTNCFDVLNIHEMSKLNTFYNEGIKARNIKASINDKTLIGLFAQKNSQIKAVRELYIPKIKIHNNSNLWLGAFISYRILDISVINKIEIVNIGI